MRVELDNGTRFITNFRYNIKPSISQDPFKDGGDRFEGTQTGDYQSFDSVCSETMVGFVQKVHGQGSYADHRSQCFYAKQTNHLPVWKSQRTEDSEGVKMDKIVQVNSNAQMEPVSAVQTEAADGEEATEPTQEQPATEVQVEANVSSPADEENIQLEARMDEAIFGRTSHKRFNAHHAHVASDENDLLISTINDMDLGWKADVCKLQKHHPSYGSHCEDQALNLAQVQAKADLESENKLFEEHQNFQAAWSEAKMFQKKYPDAQSIPDSELPENFDWRDIKGVDFTSKHRDQGHCGSCYTVSFTQIAEMRLKLKYGKKQPILSPQFLMTCNYMNEGCDGGWPFFHGFMAENGYLVTEECAPYKGKTKGDSCDRYQSCAPHSKIDNTYFVGKGYGDSSEKKMMKEIMRNGLVNGELQCPHVFSMYQSGVLTQSGIKQLHKKVLTLA
jgi:hypothetical protein